LWKVEAGGVEAIVENIKLCMAQVAVPPVKDYHQVSLLKRAAGGVQSDQVDNRLHRYCYQVLSIVADSTFGRKKLLRYRIIEGAFDVLEKSYEVLDVLFIFHVLRFIEVCCQHRDTRQFMMLKANAVERLCNAVALHMKRSPMLCLPALGALRYIILFEPEKRAAFREGIVAETLLEFSKSSVAQGRLREKAWSAAHLLLEEQQGA